MPLPDFNREELHVRNYLLTTDFHEFRHFRREFVNVVPALFIAGYALTEGAQRSVWLGFAYLLGLYVWRICGSRGPEATRSLVEKYEAKIIEMDQSRDC